MNGQMDGRMDINMPKGPCSGLSVSMKFGQSAYLFAQDVFVCV